MPIFKKSGKSILVDAPILEVYLPYDYCTRELYFVVGENIRYFCVGNFKVFEKESQLEHRERVKTIPLGLATFVYTHPSETYVEDVQFVKDGIYRKCIILRYFKNDKFLVNEDVIRSADNCVTIMDMIENGKLDYIPASCIAQTISKAQDLNGMNLKLPEEYVRTLVAERYRDPEHKSRKIRFADNKDADKVISVTAREETMNSSTFQGISFEDINTSLLIACNRKAAGVTEEETIMEKIIKGKKVDV